MLCGCVVTQDLPASRKTVQQKHGVRTTGYVFEASTSALGSVQAVDSTVYVRESNTHVNIHTFQLPVSPASSKVAIHR